MITQFLNLMRMMMKYLVMHLKIYHSNPIFHKLIIKISKFKSKVIMMVIINKDKLLKIKDDQMISVMSLRTCLLKMANLSGWQIRLVE